MGFIVDTDAVLLQVIMTYSDNPVKFGKIFRRLFAAPHNGDIFHAQKIVTDTFIPGHPQRGIPLSMHENCRIPFLA
jgi:hypothetical protein